MDTPRGFQLEPQWNHVGFPWALQWGSHVAGVGTQGNSNGKPKGNPMAALAESQSDFLGVPTGVAIWAPVGTQLELPRDSNWNPRGVPMGITKESNGRPNRISTGPHGAI